MFKDNVTQGFYREGAVIFNDNKNTDFTFLEDIIVINNDKEPCFIPNSENKLSLYDFLHGFCNIFALRLHKQFGYKIVNVYSYEKSLIHSFCIDEEDNLIDIRGKTKDYNAFWGEFEDWIEIDYWEENPSDNEPTVLVNKFDKEIYKDTKYIIDNYVEYFR